MKNVTFVLFLTTMAAALGALLGYEVAGEHIAEHVVVGASVTGGMGLIASLAEIYRGRRRIEPKRHGSTI